MTVNWPPPQQQRPQPPAPRPVPTDVHTAFQLWWGVIGFGLVNLIASLALLFEDRGEYAKTFRDDLVRRDPSVQLTQASAEHFLIAGLVVVAVLGLVVAGIALLIDFQMRKGRNWARMLLTMIGSFLVFLAIPGLFGLGEETGIAALVVGGSSIVQAVLAGGAIFLMHRKESNGYFLRFPGND